MQVRFKSLPESDVTRLFDYALKFYAKELGVGDDITLAVYTLDDMHISGATGLPAPEGEAVTGAVYFDMPAYDTSQMELFKLGVWYGLEAGALFQVMAHEMVHVSQYVSGILRTTKYHGEVTNYWEGEVVTAEDHVYETFPWEIDAYSREVALINKLADDPEFMRQVHELAAKQ